MICSWGSQGENALLEGGPDVFLGARQSQRGLGGGRGQAGSMALASWVCLRRQAGPSPTIPKAFVSRLIMVTRGHSQLLSVLKRKMFP